MADFTMPSLGADMEAATLVRWHVAAGDAVHRGQVVAEVETDKGVLDVEIFSDGVVEELVAKEGEKLKVGALLARLRGRGEAAAAPSAAPAAPPAMPPAPSAGSSAPAAAAATPPREAPSRPRRSSPAARVLAETSGIDLAAVDGSGPGGAVTVEDVKRAIAAAPRTAAPVAAVTGAAPAAARNESQRAAMRAAIAALMARSKREIPHYYLSTDIDMSAATAWLAAENAARPVTARLLPAALLLRAVALSVKQVPEVNGLYTGDAFSPSAPVHLGVAISLKDAGLLAPAILDAEALGLAALMTALQDLVARARAGKLRASEMSSPTITVTNLGDQGVDSVFGVIYPPQVAIVGFGRIRERPAGMPGARPTLTATLAADHRVSDGHRGALFLAAIDKALQRPEAL